MLPLPDCSSQRKKAAGLTPGRFFLDVKYGNGYPAGISGN
jgi:hypothetical protein